MNAFRKLMFLVSGLFILVTLASISPYIIYYVILRSHVGFSWYKVDGLSPIYYSDSKDRIPLVQEKIDDDKWKIFHLKDVLVPLPVRDPLYNVVPVLNYFDETHTQIGFSFVAPNGREFSQIHLLENTFFEYQFRSQKLFQIPLVEKRLTSIKLSQIWEDLFKKNLNSFPVGYTEVFYNLYLLQLRISLFPKSTEEFTLNKNSKIGIIKIHSVDKDFTTELVMTNENGLVYSYLLKTAKGNAEAERLRSFFLNNISFRRSSQDLSSFIYKEFKSIPFKEQVSQQGMLYLFSAWTHWSENQEFLRQMVEFLERGGPENDKQLRALYDFNTKKYGMTFSQKQYLNKQNEPELELKRQIELETKKKEDELQKEIRKKSTKEIPLSKEEQFMYELQRAKNQKKKKNLKIRYD